MSGGHWDYIGNGIGNGLQDIADAPAVQERWPELGKLFAQLGPILHDIEHDMDWDLSGDSKIPDDKEFEKLAISKILVAAMRAAPDPSRSSMKTFLNTSQRSLIARRLGWKKLYRATRKGRRKDDGQHVFGISPTDSHHGGQQEFSEVPIHYEDLMLEKSFETKHT